MKPTLDERMDAWLNEQADLAEVPDVDRQRFIDLMRGTGAFARTRFGLAWSDFVTAIRDALFSGWRR